MDKLDIVFKVNDTSAERAFITSSNKSAIEAIDSSNGQVSLKLYFDGSYFKGLDASGGLDKEDTKTILSCWIDQVKLKESHEKNMNDRLAKLDVVYCIQDVGCGGNAKDDIVTSDYDSALSFIKAMQDNIGMQIYFNGELYKSLLPQSELPLEDILVLFNHWLEHIEDVREDEEE